MNKRRWMIVALVFLFVIPVGTPAFAWDKIVAFGDSLSDNGNADGYGFGVWTNGDVWLEYLANEMNTELEDRALGGALTSGHNSGSPDYGLDWQVDLYISQLPAEADLSGTLFSIWIGGNDFLYMGSQDPAVVISKAITNISASIQKLIAAGAEDILVMNLPDLGLAPQYNWDPNVSAGASYLAATFNTYELQLLCGLHDAFPSVKFYMVDTFELLGYVVANPEPFGFSNVSGADGALYNYEGYIFYDAVHPTTDTHKAVAAATIAQVKHGRVSGEMKDIIHKIRLLHPRMPFIVECGIE